MLTVYCMDIRQAERVSEEAFQRLFPKRLQRAQRYHFSDDRARCICVGLLLHERLGLAENDILYNAYGKPYAENAPCFSVSHSGGYTVLAVSDTDVGIDIERVDDIAPEAMEQVFTRDEMAYATDMERLYKLWTLKESLSKAIGIGLGMPLKTVSVLPFLFVESVRWQGKSWYGSCRSVDEGKYILSCVSQTKEKPEIIMMCSTQHRKGIYHE